MWPIIFGCFNLIYGKLSVHYDVRGMEFRKKLEKVGLVCTIIPSTLPCFFIIIISCLDASILFGCFIYIVSILYMFVYKQAILDLFTQIDEHYS